MLQMVKISKTFKMKVFTDEGDFFGDVDDAIIIENRIDSWKIAVVRGSMLERLLKSAKGVIVPHNLVNAIGDIMIISKVALPKEGKD